MKHVTLVLAIATVVLIAVLAWQKVRISELEEDREILAGETLRSFTREIQAKGAELDSLGFTISPPGGKCTADCGNFKLQCEAEHCGAVDGIGCWEADTDDGPITKVKVCLASPPVS